MSDGEVSPMADVVLVGGSTIAVGGRGTQLLGTPAAISPAALGQIRDAVERGRQVLREARGMRPDAVDKLNRQRAALNEEVDRLRRSWNERVDSEGFVSSGNGGVVVDAPPMWLADP